MCWIRVQDRVAHMLGHCWNKQQFETMKAIFPRSEIMVCYPDKRNARLALADMEYDSSCIRREPCNREDVTCRL